MTSERDAAPGGSADNYYDLLGLAPGASDEEIEAAYADLSSMFAAGKVPASRQEYARKQRARLAAAYSVLADPDQRGAYDRRLGAGSRPPVTPALPAELRAEAQQITIAPGAVTDVDAADLPPPVPIPEAPAALPVTPLAVEAPAIEPVTPLAVEPLAPGPVALPWEAPAEAAPAAPPVADPETETLAGTTTVLPAAAATVAAAQGTDAAEDEDEEPWEEDEDEDEDEEADEESWDEDEDDGEEPDEEHWEADADAISEDDIPPPPVRPVQPAAQGTNKLVAGAAAGAALVGAAAASGAAPAVRPGKGSAPASPSVPAANPSGSVRVEPAKPAKTGAIPPPPPRTGGVALPSRREAAEITARQQAAAAAPPPPPAPVRRPRPQPARRYEYEEYYEAPRSRAARPEVAPTRRRRRNNSRLAYQVMTLVIGMVLVLGTVASVLTGITTSTPPATSPQLDAATLVVQGNVALQSANWTSAEALFSQAVQTDPNNLDALLGLARTYQGRGQPNDAALARSYATQIIQKSSSSTQAQQALSILAALSTTPAASPAAATPTEALPAGSTPGAAPTP